MAMVSGVGLAGSCDSRGLAICVAKPRRDRIEGQNISDDCFRKLIDSFGVA